MSTEESATGLAEQPTDAARDLAIDVSGLVVRYDDFEAVKGIDLQVRKGEILAFLGPNGAGKTSTVEVLEGYVKRAAGSVSVLGVDPQQPTRAWRERIGIVLQESTLDADLTAAELLTQFGSYFSEHRPVGELLELVGLTKVQNTRSSKLSGGEKRRLDVAMALVGNPELVFLDEPTTGFDPAARRQAWQMILDLRSLGVTVLLTTHYMAEAQHLADRIAVISEGCIVGNGTPSELVEQLEMRTLISWNADQVDSAAGGFEAVEAAADDSVKVVDTPDGKRMRVFTHNNALVLRELLARSDGDAIAASVAVEPPSLEQSYLVLVGEDDLLGSE